MQGPVFIKPFEDKSAEISALSQKLEAAPPAAKFIFREALTSLSEKVKLHTSVFQAISTSGHSFLALHDLNVSCKSGSAAVDFIILSPNYIIVVVCRNHSSKIDAKDLWDELPVGSDQDGGDAEHAAYVVSEMLRTGRILPGKALRNIWPVTAVTAEAIEKNQIEAFRSVPTAPSPVYPEVHKCQMLSPEGLISFLSALNALTAGSELIPVKKLYSASEKLQAYDTEVSCRPAAYRTATNKED
jgi:hypothetical protein